MIHNDSSRGYLHSSHPPHPLWKGGGIVIFKNFKKGGIEKNLEKGGDTKEGGIVSKGKQNLLKLLRNFPKFSPAAGRKHSNHC